MRTNVVIDDRLMNRARKSAGATTKKATIEAGLRLLVQMDSQARLRRAKGRVTWSGDLTARSASNYRRLRERGITVRKTIDVIIATFCVEHDLELIQSDRDFDLLSPVLGLRTR